jgi:hypothetical protein
MTTITTNGHVIKAKKAPIVKTRKPRKCVNKREFPKHRDGWTTLDYVYAYHAANASVHLTMVEYACK